MMQLIILQKLVDVIFGITQKSFYILYHQTWSNNTSLIHHTSLIKEFFLTCFVA